MIEIKTKEIDGKKYEVSQLGAKQGRTVLVRLFKVIGPALSEIAAGESFETTAGPAIARLCSQMNEDDFSYICDAMIGCSKLIQIATLDNGPKEIKTDLSQVFDDHFRGRYLPMMQWLAFALEVNFLDFLGGQKIGSLAGLIQRKSPSQSQTE